MTERYKIWERYQIVWGLKSPIVTPNEKFVLLALNEHADADGGNCYPSRAKLAEETGLKSETVSRLISSLKKKGLVKVEKRFKDGAQTSNNYKLLYGVMLTANPVTQNHTPCDFKSPPLSHEITPPVTQNHTPCDFKSPPPVTQNHTDPSILTHPITHPITREKEARENLPQVMEESSTDGGKKQDPFLNRQSPLAAQKAIAQKHAVKNSPFTSVEEQDEFYQFLFQRFVQEPKTSPAQSELYANAVCLRFCKGESQSKDRQYLKEFREGLTRLSRTDEIYDLVNKVLSA